MRDWKTIMVQYLKISWSYVRQYWHQLFITNVMCRFHQSTGSIAERIGSFCSHTLCTAVNGDSGWRSSPLCSKNTTAGSNVPFRQTSIVPFLYSTLTGLPLHGWRKLGCVSGWRQSKTITTDPHSRCKVKRAHRLGKTPTWQVDKLLRFSFNY